MASVMERKERMWRITWSGRSARRIGRRPSVAWEPLTTPLRQWVRVFSEDRFFIATTKLGNLSPASIFVAGALHGCSEKTTRISTDSNGEPNELTSRAFPHLNQTTRPTSKHTRHVEEVYLCLPCSEQHETSPDDESVCTNDFDKNSDASDLSKHVECSSEDSSATSSFQSDKAQKISQSWVEENFEEFGPVIKKIGEGFKENYLAAKESVKEDLSLASDFNLLIKDLDELEWMKDESLRDIVFRVRENELSGRDPFHMMETEDKHAFFKGLEKEAEKKNSKLANLHKWIHSRVENLDYGADGVSLDDPPEKFIPRWKGPSVDGGPEFLKSFQGGQQKLSSQMIGSSHELDQGVVNGHKVSSEQPSSYGSKKCIELYRVEDGVQKVGFYALEMAEDLELDPKPRHVIAFEDPSDSKNFCYILQAHLEMLGNGSAFIVGQPAKDVFRQAKANGFNVTVIRKGEIELNVDKKLEEVEDDIMEIGSKMYHDEIMRERSVDMGALMKGVFGVRKTIWRLNRRTVYVVCLSGLVEAAIKSYTQALLLRPDFPEATCNLLHTLQGSILKGIPDTICPMPPSELPLRLVHLTLLGLNTFAVEILSFLSGHSKSFCKKENKRAMVIVSSQDQHRDELPSRDKAEKEKVEPLDVLPSETALDSGSTNKTRYELLIELEAALMDKSNQCTETVSKLKTAVEEVTNLRRELDISQKLLDECQMNCAHLENCLHEAREEARTNLCAADRRASEYSALCTSAVKTPLSLASSANENEDDATADISACIRLLAEKVSFLFRQREEMLERCSRAKAAQTHLTKELEEKKELVKSLYAKHQLEIQQKVSVVVDLSFENAKFSSLRLDLARVWLDLVRSGIWLGCGWNLGLAGFGSGLAGFGSGLAETGSGLAEIDSGLAEIGLGLAEIGLGLAEIGSGLAEIGSGLAEIGSGLAEIGSGLAEIGSGLAEIGSGLAEMGSGIAEIDSAHREKLDNGFQSVSIVSRDSMSDYENIVGGKLKLKGKALDVAGGVKKKKKKKYSRQHERMSQLTDEALSKGENEELEKGQAEDENEIDKLGDEPPPPLGDDNLTPAERLIH
ncbi:hypothetical protein H6P81_007239 [Aristolochia fimbriata]|uniref:Uncharacterized protein n=1 Tax=Aristolochia fimbriata TaxID=158543 RepID=A0AAV7EZL7_ARIFI|nr:hypothetical protein H6P81_007239 [Aristolochia fimbriata]